MRLLCPAKLNLGLRIVGRRDDGFHLLESLFWPIDLTDKIDLELAASEEDVCEWSPTALRKDPLPVASHNLARRALNILEKKESYSIRTEKCIPMGAGLGGGSSNAGAILRYFGASLETAKKIGSDVPYFLDTRPAWVSGVGDEIAYLNVSPACFEAIQFLLVIPDFPLSTQEVFRRYRESELAFSLSQNPFSNLSPSLEEIFNYLRLAQNDLLKAAVSLQPSLRDILEEIKKLNPDFWCMTGSGSTCVGVWVQRKAPSIKDLTRPFRTLRCRVSIVQSFVDNSRRK